MQLKKAVEPFGEVNVYPEGGDLLRVTATILMAPNKEGTQTGLAIDGSGSMRHAFGVRKEGEEAESGGGMFGGLFGGSKKVPDLPNTVREWGQKITPYLAEKLDADGGTTVIYWAQPPKGKGVKVVGDLTANEAKSHPFNPPDQWGAETHLLPAVSYFCDRFKEAPWGFYVFITDGELHDLDRVKDYTKTLAQDIVGKRRNPVKLLLLGVGDAVKEAQMTELDDLDTGTGIDIWDHKIAKDMRVLEEIFAEVVDKNARVADKAKILDPSGKTIKDFSDTGLCAWLEFLIPQSCESFTLEVADNKVVQPLR